jgi:O-antigen ligase
MNIFKNLTQFQKKQTILFVLMMISIVVFLFVRDVPVPLFTSIFLGLLTLWIATFYFEGTYQIEDVPFLLLAVGTFAFGRAFSIISLVSIGKIPVPVTETILALCAALMVFKWKGVLNTWKTLVPKDFKLLLPVYLVVGTVYLLLGLKANGAIAVRDIVFCHYMLFLFITLHVFSKPEKIKKIFTVFIPGVVTLLLLRFIINFITRTGKVSFIKFLFESREFNWALYCGLAAIFALSFFTLKNKKILKWGLGLVVYFGMLFMLLTEIRAGWMGMIPALILLAFMLKKEIKIILLILPLIVVSLLFIDTYIHGNTLEVIKQEITGLTPGDRDTRSQKNVAFRLQIWGQTIDKIKEKPVFGWGYGSFPTYYIDKRPLHKPSGSIGPGSRVTPAHNHLLAMTYKMGLLGIAVFILINLRVFLMGVLHLGKSESAFHRRFLAAALTGLVYWHGMAFFFDVLESPPTGIFLWIILGLIISIVHVDRQNSP